MDPAVISSPSLSLSPSAAIGSLFLCHPGLFHSSNFGVPTRQRAQRPLSHMWTPAGVFRCGATFGHNFWILHNQLSSLVTLRTEPRVSVLTCEIKGIKSVSVSGGDHVCSLIFLPNRRGSLPGTVPYARSVTSSLWMIHGNKLPPTGMGWGGKAHTFNTINLCTFNSVFSYMSKWW